MAGVHEEADQATKDGRAKDKNGDGQPDVTPPPGKPSDTIEITNKQLNKKFKHADDFGVEGNNNFANQQKFREAINAHVDSPGTDRIEGTYRGQDVVHYVDPTTGLNVVTTPDGKFVSAWKLSEAQLWHVLDSGNLGGA